MHKNNTTDATAITQTSSTIQLHTELDSHYCSYLHQPPCCSDMKPDCTNETLVKWAMLHSAWLTWYATRLWLFCPWYGRWSQCTLTCKYLKRMCTDKKWLQWSLCCTQQNPLPAHPKKDQMDFPSSFHNHFHFASDGCSSILSDSQWAISPYQMPIKSLLVEETCDTLGLPPP